MKTTEDVLTEVIECFTTAEAELVRAHLGSEGVDANVMADDVGGMYRASLSDASGWWSAARTWPRPNGFSRSSRR
ncbi:MAG: hypothetical protein ACXWH0_06535 [Acidimicrobiia bacterium]